MVWVVDGLGRKRDLPSFDKTRHLICREPLMYSGDQTECALLRDWGGRLVDVFLDFGSREEDLSSFGGPIMWHLHPNSEGLVILTPVPRISSKGFTKRRRSIGFASNATRGRHPLCWWHPPF